MNQNKQESQQETFAQRLRRLRKQKGLTLKEVATEIGVPYTTYRDWEYGKAVQGEPYLKICDALSVGLTELFTGNLPDKNSVTARIRTIQAELLLLEKEIRRTALL